MPVSIGPTQWSVLCSLGRLARLNRTEADPAVRAIAERLVGRLPTAAKCDTRFLSDRAILASDLHMATYKEGAVRPLLYRGFLRHGLLRPSVLALEVQGSGGTEHNGGCYRVRGCRIHVNPGSLQWLERLG